jgi:hypothetical protein
LKVCTIRRYQDTEYPANRVVVDETLETLLARAEKRKEALEQQEREMTPEVQLEDGVSYLEDDDPFRLDGTQSTSARASSKYAWVSMVGEYITSSSDKILSGLLRRHQVHSRRPGYGILLHHQGEWATPDSPYVPAAQNGRNQRQEVLPLRKVDSIWTYGNTRTGFPGRGRSGGKDGQ